MKRLIVVALIISAAAICQGTAPPGYNLVFEEDFDSALSISDWGPSGPGGSKWLAHTPYGGDFGHAWFGMQDGSEATVSSGILKIRAWFDPSAEHWRSALLSSVDPDGNGFSQALGYWECAMRVPGGVGTWPSFWLLGVNGLHHNGSYCEIDVEESWGEDPDNPHFNIIRLDQDGHRISGIGSCSQSTITDRIHVFGCWVGRDYVHYYIDGVETWKTPTPPEALLPLYCLIDLALIGESGRTPNPSYLSVDYIRCYAPPRLSVLSDSGQ